MGGGGGGGERQILSNRRGGGEDAPVDEVRLRSPDVASIIAKVFGKQLSLSPRVTRPRDPHDKCQNDKYAQESICAPRPLGASEGGRIFLIKFLAAY
jgi:hypothetical protein